MRLIEKYAREQAARYGVLALYLAERRNGASVLEAMLECDILTPQFIELYNAHMQQLVD